MALEIKRIKKRFFSSVAECNWLDKLGKQGYRLTFRKENFYEFELTEKEWHYRVEWMDCAPESEEWVSYLQSCEMQGLSLATSYSLWAYFVSESPIPFSEDARKRTAVHYRNIAFLIYAADAVVAILIAYHISIRDFLTTQKVFLEAPEFEEASNFIINLCRRLVYGGEILLYRYAKLLANIFGDTKATMVLGILIPLAVILSVVGAFWLAEWRKNCSVPAVENKQEDANHVHEEPKASGETENGC